MGLMLNWVAAGLLALTIAFYVFVYTMWLKRWTPQNIVIGGAAGAVPPMIGWAAATGTVSLESFVLFLIIFVWTPPHFWALALVRVRDYERAGVPMLPVVRGEDETRRQILIYSLILAPLGCVPALLGLGGGLYTIAAGFLGAFFVMFAYACYTERVGRGSRTRGQESLRLFGVVPVPVVRSASGRAGLRLEPQLHPAALDLVMTDEEDERQRRQRMRSIAIAWALAALVVLFFVVTIVRLGANVAHPLVK